MKKAIFTLSIALLSTVSVFSQKNELKAAEKALKNSDFNAAMAAITTAEGLTSQMDDKLLPKFYFLKGQTLAGKKEFKAAYDVFTQLKEYEEKIGKKKYSDDVQPLLQNMIQEVSKRAIKLYNDKDFKNATRDFYLTYVLSPIDTSFLFNAAITANAAKDFDTSLEYYKKLREINYTGIATQYLATNAATGEVENLGSKSYRDLMVRSKAYTDPKEEVSESKVADIITNMALVYQQQGKIEEAIAAFQEARKSKPKDIDLILGEADLYIKLDKMDKFGELMILAVEQNPTNPVLYYNLGVVNYNSKKYEDARKYYEKAIELKPDYADAYNNIAAVILEKERPIIEEMNKNLSDFDKYDELLEKQKAVKREALPYLEKADQIQRTENSTKILMNIYESLGNMEKAKEFRKYWEALKDQ